MAVAYRPSYSYSSPYGGSAVSRRHEFGEREPSQVISYDRHQSAEMPPYNGHPRHHASVSYYAESASHSSPSTRYHPGSSLRRAATTSSVSHEPPREHSGSMAGMLGMAAVGAVAGAALTYSVMSGRSSRSRRLEEPTTAPSFQRRSTYPDAYPEYGSAPSRYIGQEGMRARSRKPSLEIEEVLDYDDGRSRNSSSHRYRSSSRPAAGIRAITDTPPAHAPQLLLGEGDAMYGGGSYAPSRYDGSHAPSRRSTSRAPSRYEGSHAPLRYDGTRAPSQHEGSRASSRHEASRAPSQYEVAHAPSQYDSPHAPPLSHRSATFDTPGGGDRDSYVSSRSHRTEATLRGSSRQPSAPPSASRSAHVSHAASRSSSYRSARDVPLPPSRVSSYRSSRDVPLPPSGVGSSHARWDAYPDEDNDPMLFDDNDSVAPSDSISCVGSRGQRYH